jgi:hypothetical protein
MGRKKGSKNKPKINVEVLADNTESKNISPDNGIKHGLSTSTSIKRGRGRPKGAKAKPKEIKETSQEIRRIRTEIKDLRTKKRLVPKGSQERKDIYTKIKELKLLLIDKKEKKEEIVSIYAGPEKIPLIKEIQELDPIFLKLELDLSKYSKEQLQKHIECIKRKRGI